MDKLKKINSSKYITDLFRNLSRIKNIPIVLTVNSNQFIANMNFSAKKGNTPSIVFESGRFQISDGEKVKISLVDKELNIFFETISIGSSLGNSFDIEIPKVVSASFPDVSTAINMVKKNKKPSKISPLKNTATKNIVKIIKNSSSENNKTNKKHNKELISRIDELRNAEQLFYGFSYKADGNFVAIGAALRIYENTYFGNGFTCVNQQIFEPDPWLELYSGLSEKLLVDSNCENYIINIPNEWQFETMSSIEGFINNHDNFKIDKNDSFLCNITKINDKATKQEYICESVEDIEPFLEFGKKNIGRIIMKANNYNANGFFLDEINKIYKSYNYFRERKLISIKNKNDVIAYAVMEVSSETLEFNGNNDNIKLYFSSENANISNIIRDLLPTATKFYKKFGKKNFRIIMNTETHSINNYEDLGIEFENQISQAVMNKSGLNDYRILLGRNFIDFNKYYRLTYPQIAIWQTEKFFPDTGFGNIVGNSFIDDDIDFELLEKAINIVVKNNDGYGIRIVEEGEIVRQYFKKYSSFKVDFFDFSLIGGYEAFKKWNEAKTQEPFKIIDSQLFYIAVFKISKNYCGIYYKMHHLISDAWTSVTKMSNVVEYYYKLKNDVEIREKREPSYIDFIMSEDEYLTSEAFRTHKEFWNKKYETVPEFTNLVPTGTVYRNIKSARKTKVLSKKISDQIKEFCLEYKSSPLTLFLALFYIYIYRISMKSDIVIGTPVLNRSNAREKNIVGMFISVVPVRFNVDGTMDFASFISSLSKEFTGLLRNQKYPYDLIQSDFREKHKVNENLFDTMVSFQNVKIENENLECNHKIEWVFNGYQTDSLQMHIGDRGNTGEFELDFDYLADTFSESTIERLSEQIINMLEEILDKPKKIINDIELVPVEEKQKLLYEFNNTDRNYPKDMTVQELFEEQVKKTPDNIALVFKEEKMTYREMNNRVNALATVIRNRGVKPDEIVGIMIDRSFEMIIGILAILKAGGAYMPLDSNYPEDRLNYMIEDSKCRIVLMQKSNTNKLKFEGEYVYIEDQKIPSKDIPNPKNICKSNNLAYLIYTSGSTGQPKGVMVEQHGLSNLKVYFEDGLGITEKDRITQFFSCSFDASVWEIFMAMLTGATLYIMTKDIIDNYIKFENFLNVSGITVTSVPPSYLTNINPDNVHTLKMLVTGGSSITLSLVKKWCKKVTYINSYGPTESTVCATEWKCEKDDEDTEIIPIGKPVTNTKIYILNQFNKLQPIGAVGEICISGDSLARGYLGKSKLTREKFVPCPFIKGKMMYRTGDLAKWLPDGNIEFLGRIDGQIKIRGFRVEMGEIENILLNHEQIRDAIVVYKQENNGNSYLCAYVVMENSTFTEAELKNYLSKKLPGFMVPSHIIAMDLLPMNANGKVDKTKLPEPIKRIENSKQESLPENSTEKELLAVWKDALNRKDIGVNDNIFELGADSLSIMRVLTATFKFGWDITMQDFYEHQTISELSNKILRNSDEDIIKKVDNDEIQIYALPETSKAPITTNKIENVLLTGVTGFLGIHVLSNILEFTKANVYCIIRGEDASSARSKLLEKLIFYFGNTYYNQLMNKRVIILNGDITSKLLGLGKTEYDKLAKKIDTVIHCAALVKHFGDYSIFEKTNIIGTKRIIDFCNLSGARLNHVSTISIAGDFFDNEDNGIKFTENDFYIGQNLGDNVYLKSKFEAEKMILEAAKKGLNVSIFRVGNLTGRYSDGKFQSNMENNRFYNLLKFFIKMKMLSTNMQDWEVELTPVDLCAYSIVELSKVQNNGVKIYHLYNPKRIILKNIIESFNLLGSKIDFVENEEYKKRIGQIANDDTKEILMGVINDLNRDGMFKGATPFAVSCEITEEAMSKFGIKWLEIDHEYLEKIYRHMEQVGFIS